MGLVYHYTSPQAALSILQNKTLWFTDCEFLNDPAELAYCYELYNQAWVEVCRELGISEERIPRKITEHANSYECKAEASDELGFDVPARYYVLSTSSAADSTALWSNYAGRRARAGYALGFDAKCLMDVLQNIATSAEEYGMLIEVSCGEVVYDRDRQLRILKPLIRDYLGMQGVYLPGSTDALDQVIAKEISRDCHWSQISAAAPFIKQPEFSYEQEYRFVLKTTQIESRQKETASTHGNAIDENDKQPGCSGCSASVSPPIQLLFREGFAGAITPYLEAWLGDAMDAAFRVLCFQSHQSPRLVKEGMTRLLAGSGYGDIPIEMSNCHLRG